MTWWIWLILALVLIVIEMFTAGFAVICFGIGCLFAAIPAALDLHIAWSITVAIVVSLLCFVLVRPFVLKFLSRGKELATNADAIIGRIGVVSETIDAETNTGRVAIDGDDWKAECRTTNIINKGEKVKVVSRESLILTV